MPTEKGKTAKKSVSQLKRGEDLVELGVPMIKPQPQITPKSEPVLREEQVLQFWKDHSIFEKSVKARASGKPFIFYEGPPTANAAPGFHHIEARSFKDVIPRFKSMQGYYVPRRGGWDTHGLPVEIQVEKALGFKSKQDIEQYGIAAFNEQCRKAVWQYVKDWENLTERIAFWLDMARPYITYEKSYMESLWWMIAEFWKKKLLYQDFKVLPWCTRCGTGLSSHEIALGYKSIVDTSVYIRFKLTSQDPKWKNVAILSWTTTPWTLPGNVALAVSEGMQYVRVPDPEKKGNWVVVGQDNFSILVKRGVLPKDSKASVPFLGKELVGLTYQPLFDVPELVTNNSYKIYAADFVLGTEGTGVVHTAVMYGEDDYRLGKKVGLPAIHTVSDNGKFVAALGNGLGGKYVKAKETDLFILQHLQKIGSLFREEAYEHDYPFCWRCDTPILYYARTSWWLRVNAVRKDVMRNNETIHWVPSHLKHGRFGEWLKEEKDWAFSRERYWGTTLPLWKCNACGAVAAVSSVEELSSRAMSSGNRYILMRHGEAENLTKDYISSWPETSPAHLTEKGRADVERAGPRLVAERIDVVMASDLVRTKETLEVLKNMLGDKEIIFDERLREIDTGDFNGGPAGNYRAFFKNRLEKYETKPPNGESLQDVRRRMLSFFRELEAKYRGKTILIITHADPIWMLVATIKGESWKESAALWPKQGEYIAPGEFEIFEPKPLPRNVEGEIDLHRPYVDEIKMRCSCGGVKARIPEVADVWFDSGAMPFAAIHYPFENVDLIEKRKNFPADYICEAVDQTRGWFYTLLAESTLLAKGAPYKNVISLGHVLDKHGHKMSKSRGNIVNPWAMIDTYGVDAIRWYFYTVNAPGDPKKFDEKDLAAKLRGFLGTLWNSWVLFDTYTQGKVSLARKSGSLLDRWILSRLQNLIQDVTRHLEAYDVVSAARLVETFTVEDFSNWYLRRSRRRFQRPSSKKEKAEVAGTTREVLLTLLALVAPFTPYIADAIYRELSKKFVFKEESVHLRDWPIASRARMRPVLEKKMETLRLIAAEALKARAAAGIKVRQPLAALAIRHKEFSRKKEMQRLLEDEVNVKKIIILPQVAKGPKIILDTTLTEGLRREGLAREIVRNIQELRRDLGLLPQDAINLQFLAGEKSKRILKEWQGQIKRDVGAKKVILGGKKNFKIEREIPVGGSERLWIGIR
ncbi:MAG: class I tRNA ligase family protein [Candidatus Sungbacteria bacterium]|uniref:isoleucine--tRNA ligase n=1 Tax=Candidatus Sungiibacteriota bacterium TaxID=2750080 RepID=A0A9D6QS81_9BACT|nr:class I tRNA ligase family protein [Candidatus Sungbacteria bacterium]